MRPYRFTISLLAVGLMQFMAGALASESPAVISEIARGDSLLDNDDIDAAIDAYRLAVKGQPGDARAYQRLGRALSLRGDLDDAARAELRAIELDPGNALAHSNLGWIYGLQKKYRQSVAEELVAIRLNPDSVGAHLTLGLALTSLGDYEGAIKAYARVIELDPENSRVYVNLAAALGRKGDYASAIAAYREALRLNPSSLSAHLGIGAALGKVGDLKGQVMHFQEAVKLAPASDSAHGKLGWALYKSGDWQGALREGCLTNWMRLSRAAPEYIQTFASMWGAVFLLFGTIFAVIFVGSRLKPEKDEIVIKSYLLIFHNDRPGRLSITNKRVVFNPEWFSSWFGAKPVSVNRDEILEIEATLAGTKGVVKLSLADGRLQEFTMPALVFKPLRAQLEKTGARAQMKRTGQYRLPAAGDTGIPPAKEESAQAQSTASGDSPPAEAKDEGEKAADEDGGAAGDRLPGSGESAKEQT